VRGYLEQSATVGDCLEQSATVGDCLAGYGDVLGRAADWRHDTETVCAQLRSSAAAAEAFDFAAEVGVIEQDERDVETLFYRYAHAQVASEPAPRHCK